MFPLGSVLFPHMPLRLRVFEERYLLMLSELIQAEDARFGVVLIERGFEVGGGEHRFDVGTVAQIVQLGAEDGCVGLTAQGAQRFTTQEWRDDGPYPRAETCELPELQWDASLEGLRSETEGVVRRALYQASEFAEAVWSGDVELSADPVAACWQLAAIAPLGELDQLGLLRSESLESLLTEVGRLTEEAAVRFSAPWPEGE